MKVLKFGGTSVKNAENISKVIEIVRGDISQHEVLVVVSAFGGITNLLIETAQKAAKGDESYKVLFNQISDAHAQVIEQLLSGDLRTQCESYIVEQLSNFKDILHGLYLLRELSTRSLDLVSSFGERLSAYIIAHAFTAKGIPARYLDAREVIKTDKTFGAAKVNFEKTNRLIAQKVKNSNTLWIATGFIASTDDDETITLGRGGSDYSGAIFARALETNILEIWTDVDGMMTADPRKVKKAYPISNITYSEAMELSHFGAKVLEPRTVIPAMAIGIPVLIKNTFNPTAPGTLITAQNEQSAHRVQGISSIDDISLITVQGSGMIGEAGISMRLFRAIAKESINVILITQGSSEHSITFAVLPKDALRSVELLKQEFELEIKTNLIDDIKAEHNLAIVSAVGENMKNIPGVSGKFFNALGINGINVHAIAQGASELNISAVINGNDTHKALNALHESFFLSNTKTINVFVVGTGVIGGELLKQIEAQHSTLVLQNNIDVKVVGISNIDGYIIDEEGIDLQNWEHDLKNAGKKPNIDAFVNEMKALNLRNSVFVDNTASYDVADKYEEILEKSISVVTPNKVANASDYSRYVTIHKLAAETGARFYYETNVGAGLPVINTLKDLIKSGDEIIKIEAILSGSLNFIFSNCSSQKDFLSTVKLAREKGYTEPDPKIDLSGKDVARKILILSREIGCTFNLEDVEVENCLSPQSQATTTVDELWKTLEAYDNELYAKKIQEAEAAGKRIKYIASYENGKAKTKITMIDSSHPFYNVMGSDNIISFTTARYRTQPLIVIGPGAGAAVTAAGVFADIIRIGNF
jgi:aspartokinase/homoserine dehydrogenase 1